MMMMLNAEGAIHGSLVAAFVDRPAVVRKVHLSLIFSLVSFLS
jgi:hypothetical protein